ncbi:MAG: S41 family peptidase, partial [Clostridia bacterium]
ISILEKVIKSVAKSSPAEKAGILAGDIILKINDIDTTNLSDSAIAALIKGKDNTNVTIKVKREDKELEFKMKTAVLFTDSVTYKMIEETNIGYLNISIFSNTVSEQVKVALDDLQGKGMEKLIIDVRDDTGGYLEGAENIANQFLKKDKLIYSLEDKNGTTKYYDKTDQVQEIPVVILMNKNSASASEILAAALKDSYGATLIGTKSYGKGKVQQTYKLNGGGMAKYTSAKWLRPTGECIDGIGLIPDIKVEIEYTRDELDNITGMVDTQLNKAIEFLSTK